MTRHAVKVQERAAFDLAIRSLGLQIAGDIATPERPDFHFTLADGRSVGLEVVRALDEYIARGRGARNRIKARIKELMIRDATPANVHLSLTEWLAAWLAANKRALEAEATAVARLARVAIDDGTTGDWRYYHADPEDVLNDDDATRELRPHGVQYLTKVAVRRIDEEPWCTWTVTGQGQNANVQDAINDKSDKLHEYRAACPADEYWLLVLGSAATGGALDMTQVERCRFTSPFDRTIFVEAFEGRCALLDTDRPDENTPST